MIRGTTPTVTINLDFNSQDIETLYITFKQDNVVLFEKDLDDCTILSETVMCTLTQEDTLKLNETSQNNGSKKWLNVQCRCRLKDGTCLANEIEKLEILGILKEGVI